MSDPTIDNADHLSPRELVDAVLDAQRRRFAAGERPRAEEYLQRFPALVADRSLAVDVIYSEFLLRREHGEATAPAGYLDRFPQYAELLERQFVVYRAIEADSHSPDDVEATLLSEPQRVTAAQTTDDTAGDALLEIPADVRWDGFPMLGNYRVEQRIGRGGMGTVFRAVHQAMHRPVALKILPAKQMIQHRAVSRFQREMEVVARLDHPNIVRATDAGEIQGVHYLAMELVEGVDLSILCQPAKLSFGSGLDDGASSLDEQVRLETPAVRQHRLSVADVCEVIRQAAIGLEHAHQQGLVHRDVKPSNLMLTKEGQIKILDLGLALLSKHGSREQRELTSTGQLMGTFDYMAPEQANDSHDVDHRADVYSLGATMFHLLAGQPPFPAKKYNTPLKLLVALATQNAPSIAEQRDDLPNGLVAVVDRMLARHPGARFESAARVAEALAPFAEGSDLAALHAAATDASGWRGAAATEIAGSRDEHRQALISMAGVRRRTRLRTIAIACFFVLIVGTASVWFGPAVYRFATNRGLLVVECDDPDIEVTVTRNGERLKIVDRKSGRTVSLVAGQYQLELSRGKNGLRLSTDAFTLARGRQIVKVRCDPTVAKQQPEDILASEPKARTGFNVREVKAVAEHALLSIAHGIDLLDGKIPSRSTIKKVVPVIDFVDPQASMSGHFLHNAAFPGDTPANDDNFALEATALVEIPRAGAWTFGVFSDDGFQLMIDDKVIAECPEPRFPKTSLATVNFSKPGRHKLRVVYFEHAAGADLELFAAEGAHAEFRLNEFRLVGDTSAGGLRVVLPDDPESGTSVSRSY
jgi:serine/threonine protein kinase